MIKKIFLIIVLLIVSVGGWKVWSYYQSTYMGETYYALIKSPLPEETTILDDGGKSMGKGYNYEVESIDETGHSRKLNFSVITSGDYKNGQAYAEGTALKIKASAKRVIEKHPILFSDIPKNIQLKLK